MGHFLVSIGHKQLYCSCILEPKTKLSGERERERESIGGWGVGQPGDRFVSFVHFVVVAF